MEKICFLIFVFANLCLKEALAVSEEIQELMDNLHKTCVAETGAAEEAIVNARTGSFSEDETFKCYMKCLAEQMGCITDDDRIDPEAVIALLPPEISDKMEAIIRGCNLAGANACDTAWIVNKCWYEKNPALYVLP